MSPKPLATCAVAVGLVAQVLAGAAVAGRGPDRLDRFRALAAAHLATAQITNEPTEGYREIYTLLDEEIVESLASGGVFASVEFLQDRVDAFSEAWGATVVRLMRAGGLLVGAFQLTDGTTGNSVRVYGRLGAAGRGELLPRTMLGGPPGGPGGEPALLTTLSREGRPSLHPLPPVEGRIPQFVVAWEGGPSGLGTRSLRIDHARQHGDGVRVAWSTADLHPEGLVVRRWSVRGGEIRIQYELHYPGWAPGCEGQTEQEDVYRLGPGGAFARVARRQVNAWHRDFRRSVSRVLAAIEAGDTAALAGLVPDAALRGQLSRTLREEPACDARESAPPERVSVAARSDAGPWQLVFQRGAGGWRLVRASPVLQ